MTGLILTLSLRPPKSWKTSCLVSFYVAFAHAIAQFSLFFSELQNIVNPITSKLYSGGGPESHVREEDEEEFEGYSHDEL